MTPFVGRRDQLADLERALDRGGRRPRAGTRASRCCRSRTTSGASTGESYAELVWRSDDGERWEQVGTTGLNDPERYQFQSVVSVAAGAHGLLAVQVVELAESYDDSTFGIWRSDDGRTWEELEYSGLDDLDLANTDVVPRVVALELTREGLVVWRVRL